MAGLGQVKMAHPMSSLWVISGARGAGKTTLCNSLVQQAWQNQWEVAGILCPAVFENGEKVAIEAMDLRSGTKRRLAQRAQPGLPGSPHTSAWHFFDDVLAWGNVVFKNAVPCDLLVVDELGPLELEHQLGWVAALEAIHSHAYQVCLLVLRLELVNVFRSQWADFKLIELPLAEKQAKMLLSGFQGKD